VSDRALRMALAAQERPDVDELEERPAIGAGADQDSRFGSASSLRRE
jgi:hypothetical protein